MEDAAAAWAAHISQLTPLPDQRLTTRLALLLQTLAAAPTASIPEACGTWADTKAAYRFLDNDRFDDTPLANGLHHHTATRALRHPELLLVQDTTSLNLSHCHGLEELGPLESGGRARGFLLHSTLAVDPHGGVLGVLDLQSWTRPLPGQPKPDEKESGKWLIGLDQARTALADNVGDQPLPRLIHVMDREGDCTEVMLTVADAGDSAIIRCAQNRCVDGPLRLAHEAVRAETPLGTREVAVPRQAGRPARTAEVAVRRLHATLVPDREKYPHAREMAWTLVEVWEVEPPEGVERLHWRLWTLEPTATLAEAWAVVAKYTQRWLIEEYHLTLKSGCRMEQLQLKTWVGWQKALVLYAAVATRIVCLRDRSRQAPEALACELLSEDECAVLRGRCDPKHRVSGALGLAQAVLWIGRLGGHLNRKGDGMPGVRTLWKGLRALALLVEGFRLAQKNHQNS